jgi:hypothetical protein
LRRLAQEGGAVITGQGNIERLRIGLPDAGDEARIIELAMKATLDKEQKRAEEIKQRDEKIQKIMNSMGNIIQGDKDKKL